MKCWWWIFLLRIRNQREDSGRDWREMKARFLLAFVVEEEQGSYFVLACLFDLHYIVLSCISTTMLCVCVYVSFSTLDIVKR
jgi:hypothetical protein